MLVFVDDVYVIEKLIYQKNAFMRTEKVNIEKVARVPADVNIWILCWCCCCGVTAGYV